MAQAKAKVKSKVKRKPVKAGSSANTKVGGILNFKVAEIVQTKKK